MNAHPAGFETAGMTDIAAEALTPELRTFLDSQSVGVLATLAADGSPRQSVVYFTRDRDRLLISTLTNRLKARDVRRTGRASLCVMGHERPFPAATFSGPAEILTTGIGSASAAIAQRFTASAQPPEPLSDEVLAEAGRVILAITVEKVTAPSYIPTTSRNHGV